MAGDGVSLHAHGVEVYRKAGEPSDETDAQQAVIVRGFAGCQDRIGEADVLPFKIEGESDCVCPFGGESDGREHLGGRTGIEAEKVSGAFV